MSVYSQYVDSYPDIANVWNRSSDFFRSKYGNSKEEFGRQHWEKFGQRENRMLPADPSYAAYVDAYPDLKIAYASGSTGAPSKAAYGKFHWENYGQGEKRSLTGPPDPTVELTKQIQEQTQNFQNQIAQQQQTFQNQLAAQQQQAQEAQRQLMINMQRGDRAPAAVKTASSGAEQSGLTSRGTTGYFGRRGMRIGSLNVPSTGLSTGTNISPTPTRGTFA
mgnify:CR=1 FL=1